jgi:hypothetical protein
MVYPEVSNLRGPNPLGPNIDKKVEQRRDDLVEIFQDEDAAADALKSLIKKHPIFRNMAEIILHQKEDFIIDRLIARKKSFDENHWIMDISNKLNGLPVYVVQRDYNPKVYHFKLAVPVPDHILRKAKQECADNHQVLDRCCRDIHEIIIELLDAEYKNSIFYLKPLCVLWQFFTNMGTWICWDVWVNNTINAFWSQELCNMPFHRVQPFFALGREEYAIIISDSDTHNDTHDLIKAIENRIRSRNKLNLKELESIPVKYAWLGALNIESSHLSDAIGLKHLMSHLGGGIPNPLLSEENITLENVMRKINQPVCNIHKHKFSMEVVKDCSII